MKNGFGKAWSVSLASLGAAALLALAPGCDWMGGDKPQLPTSTMTTDGTRPPPPPGTDSREAAIAKCLTAQGAVLYGADWCPYTRKQIQSFKDGFRYLTYVECTAQPGLCAQRGVDAYPTWIIRGGRIEGYRDPGLIASYAGCAQQ